MKNENNKTDAVTSKPAEKSAPKKQAKKSNSKGMISGWFTFLNEVKIELKKVNWPPRREIIGSTTALIVATILFGIFLGIVDFVLAQGIQPALAGNAGVMTAATVAVFIGILLWVYNAN
jgi:preprotein translocase subunit SecE